MNGDTIMELLVNDKSLKNIKEKFWEASPFPHIVIDNFFNEKIADKLSEEFPSYESDVWYQYDNAIEVKKACNNWNVFPPLTYKVFSYLNSSQFINQLEQNMELDKLYADFGLNGGGWHIHRPGGKLNTHLDYSLHPKLGQQRKLNLIVYLEKNWKESWGGCLGLWKHDEKNNSVGDLSKQVIPMFNRAVLFDTTRNSWHGLPEPVTCPVGNNRKSLAVYYLVDAPENVDERGKALFVPYKEQKDDEDVLELIKKRSSVKTARDIYRKRLGGKIRG